MASFTDKNYPAFNPYIQQLPVEAMVNVGTAKQGQYEQGVQRIQGQIDTIAGMDVVRDIDKRYLQGKLDSLGQNLKMVAAGDFSNFQLVNSVAGLTSQIAKDPNVLNAVASTRNYRRGVQDMQTAVKEGKASPSNNWYFQSQAAEWLNSEDASASFDAQYTPYTNYRKNALDVIKNLTGDSTITEDAFTVDGEGNMVISDAIVRQKLAGISPEQIQQALLAGLTPADMRQMEIDGLYSYSNVDDASFARNLTSSYKSQHDKLKSMRDVLSNAITATTDASEKESIRNKIRTIDNQMNKVTKDYQKIAQGFESGNVDSAKANLYTTQFINDFANAFSYTETELSYKQSPYADMAMRRAVKNQDWQKFTMQYDLDLQKLQLAKDEYDLETLKFQKEWGNNFGVFPTGISEEDAPKIDMEKFIGFTTGLAESINDSDVEKMKFYVKDGTYTDGQGREQVKPEAVEWFNQMQENWEKGISIDPDLADYFDSTADSRRKVEMYSKTAGVVSDMADAKYGSLNSMISADLPDVQYRSEQGVNITFTPEEITAFNAKINTVLPQVAKMVSAGNTVRIGSIDEQKARQLLTPKEYELLKVQVKSTNNEPLNAYERGLENYRKGVYEQVNYKYENTLKDRREFMQEELSNRLLGQQPMGHPITLTNENKQGFQNIVTNVINMADNQKGGLANSPDFDADLARELVTKPNLIASMRIVPGTDFQNPIYEVNMTADGKATTFRLTPEQKGYSFMSMFEPSAESQQMQLYKTQMQANKATTTATDGRRTNITNSFLNRTDFRRTTNYGIKGNIQQSTSGGYTLRLNIFDPVEKKWHEDIPFPPNQTISEAQVPTAMLQIDDELIFKLLHNRKPEAKDMLLVEQSAKKPLNNGR